MRCDWHREVATVIDDATTWVWTNCMDHGLAYELLSNLALLALGAIVIRRRGPAGADAFRFWSGHRLASEKGYQQMYGVTGAAFVIIAVYRIILALYRYSL